MVGSNAHHFFCQHAMKAEQYLQTAKDFFQQNLLKESLQTLLNAKAEHPANHTIHQGIVQLAMMVNAGSECWPSLKFLLRTSQQPLTLLGICEKLVNSKASYDACYQIYADQIAARPANHDIKVNFGIFLRKVGNFTEAYSQFESALMHGGSMPQEIYTHLGITCERLNLHQKAEECYNAALNIDNQHTPAIMNLASLHETIGNKEEATRLYELSIDTRPDDHLAIFRLCQICSAERKIELLNQTLALLESKPDNEAAELLHYSAGKILAAQENYIDAEHHFIAANKLSKIRVSRTHGLKTNKFRYFDHKKIGEDKKCSASKSPIFICGEFRSGSTLLQQILSTDYSLACIDELPLIEIIYQQKALHDDMPIEHWRNCYYNLCNIPEIAGKQIVDKMPNNIHYFDFICQLFERPKFLFTTRNVKDIAISLYTNPFDESLPYANSIKDAIDHAASTEETIKRLAKDRSEDCLIVNYESLISSPAQQVSRVFQFLGLTYTSDNLNFAHSQSRTNTASVAQVRSSLYKSAIDHHKKYPRLFSENG